MKRAPLVLVLLLLAEAGALVWGLWPLSDPRFDWKPYFDKALAKPDCPVATLLALDAYFLYDRRSIDALAMTAKDPACADFNSMMPPSLASLPSMLESQLTAEAVAKRAKQLPPIDGWPAGWRGRRGAISYIYKKEVPSAVKQATNQHGFVAGLISLPWSIPRHLRCDFALVTDNVSRYAEMRELLAGDYPELAVPDWELRSHRCRATTARLSGDDAMRAPRSDSSDSLFMQSVERLGLAYFHPKMEE